MFPNVSTILLVVALAGPVVTWALTEVKNWTAVQEAVAVERANRTSAVAAERNACETRVSGIQSRLNNAVEENRRLADEAAQGLAPTPVEAAELQDLCNASASCLERKRETKK